MQETNKQNKNKKQPLKINIVTERKYDNNNESTKTCHHTLAQILTI